MLLASGMWLLNSEASIIMLGTLSNDECVGLYRVAQRGSQLIFFGLLAVNTSIAPTVSSLYHKQNMLLLKKVLSKSTKLLSIFSIPASLFLIASSKWLVPVVFGSDFVNAWLPLSILCFGQLFNSIIGPVGIVLNMTGNERITSKGVFISSILNIFLNAVLIPPMGVVGAAIASTISLITWDVLLTIWLYKKLKLTTLPFSF